MTVEIRSVDNSGAVDVAVHAAVARGLKAAGAAVLAGSDALAPTEPEPRHGVHMTETGFVRSEVAGDGLDQVAVGYGAFWAVFQHEDLTYNHPHGGEAKFLETAITAGADPALEILAASVREAIGG